MVEPPKPAKPFNKKAFAIAALRRASYRTRGRNAAYGAARIERGVYQCAICGPGPRFGRKEVQADHIEPVVPLTGWVDFDSFIERLYVESSGYQILCKPHHKEKSKHENALRRILSKKPKE